MKSRIMCKVHKLDINNANYCKTVIITLVTTGSNFWWKSEFVVSHEDVHMQQIQA